MKKTKIKSRKISLTKVASLINNSKNILITAHESPEGDALGSSLALGLGLAKLGKKVKIYNVDKVPVALQFLPGSPKVSNILLKNEKFDLAITVDAADCARMGAVFKNHEGFNKTLCLDHHLVGKHDADYNYVDPMAAATGVIVHRLLVMLNIKLSKAIATNLYCALSTDTGSFKYSNTNQECFEIASDLMKYKIDPWLIGKNCFENNSRPRLRLLGYLLNNIKYFHKNKVALAILTEKDFKRNKCSIVDAEGLINYLRSVEGVEVAVLITQDTDGIHYVSFRSNHQINVAAVAKKFGGGGHARASGCSFEGSVNKFKENMLKHLSELNDL